MKARDQFRKTQPTDLLVCFPPRAHLALMPKPICSPSRGAEPNKRSHHHHRRRHSFTRFGGGAPAGSPFLMAKNRQITGGGAPENSEPTSPKVTCAGQIKVRHKGGTACKSWQSVMEEIERIHIRRKSKKKSPASWIGSFGIKKEVMQFLTCLRNIKFDFRCFGAIPQSEVTSDEEEEDGEEEEFNGESSGAPFSKWFMVLENGEKGNSFETSTAAAPPPANALLLMRCRSAPAKSWQEEKEEEEEENGGKMVKREGKKGGKNLKALMEEENRMSKKELEENYNDYYRISSDIAKETWVSVGEDVKDPLSRSRSWKR